MIRLNPTSDKNPSASQFLINSAFTNGISFREFLWRTKFIKVTLFLAGVIIVIQLCIFKYFYPFAGFINGDSYAYLLSAFYNLKADVYPIGYSKFLRLFSVFFSDDSSLVCFQYLFIQISNLFLLFTIFYFYVLRRWTQFLLLAFMILNPVFLYLANYVSSDSLFFALSIIWFAHLIWIINYPSPGILITHAVIILLAFTVRYNALFYPAVAIFGMLLSKRKILAKLLGLSLSLILVISFMNFTASQFRKLTKVKQFSPFSGWQLANNAMYAYRFVDSTERKVLPERFRMLDQDVRNYFDSTRDTKKYPQEKLYASTVYMWDSISPLRIYMNNLHKNDSTRSELKEWASIAPLYRDYGSTLIKTYPITFLKFYIWPNFIKYYVPQVEFLDSYSTGVDTVPMIAKQWFGYKTSKLKIRVKDLKVNTLNFYPVLSGIINAVYIMMSLAFLWLEGRKFSKNLYRFWTLGTFFWITNCLFSVFASPVALRFQLFPFFVCFISNILLLDYIINLVKKEAIKNDQIHQKQEVVL